MMGASEYLRKKKQSDYLKLVSLIAGIIGLVGSIMGAFLISPPNDDKYGIFHNIRIERRAPDTQKQVAELRLLIEKVQQQSRAIQAVDTATIPDAALKGKLAEFDQVKSDVADLKAVILENPTKAIALVLMQKELAQIEKRQDDLSSAMDVQVGRIYDFSKWFFALLITICIGLVTMGFAKPARKSD